MNAMNSSRRTFLRQATSLSVAGVATPWMINLASITAASAAASADYRAIVCVFLYGGNDYGNTLIPYDETNYARYQQLRPVMAFPRDSLAPTALTPTETPMDAEGGSRQYALAPALAPLVPLFDAGRMAIVLNIGTLVQPTSKEQYRNRSVPLPPKLFSHNDQQSIWQSSVPEGAANGWGGRLGDLFASGNGNATFSCVNVSGNAVFLSGTEAVQYQVSPGGAVKLNGLSSPLFGASQCSDALRTLICQPREHLFENEYNRVMRRSLEAGDALTSALANAPGMNTAFPESNPLAEQLSLVARMMSNASAIGAKRQLFFVSLGGFDTHLNLATSHPVLMKTLADAMSAFDQALRELGIADKVTTFTASDFGRTLTANNNNGADHGWGSVHFVMGGAVRGKRFYGKPPAVAHDGPDDVGQGRLLPTTSVDQYAATLGRWLGVSDTDLRGVLPGLTNFDPAVRNLGFLS